LLITKQNPIRAAPATNFRYFSDRLLATLIAGRRQADTHTIAGDFGSLPRRRDLIKRSTGRPKGVFAPKPGKASGGCPRAVRDRRESRCDAGDHFAP
jgi:hypothetical protein